MGHVIQCLNKLDVGDSEKILLTSRDKRSILIASYEDVKRCLDGVSTYTDISTHQQRAITAV
jgi:PAB-dependent poly(A)-specific ribonuclease subunit 3